MIWFRKVSFRKITYIEDNYCRMVTDGSITSFVLKKARHFGLDLRKIYLSDVFPCTIELWGEKQEFLAFVQALAEEFKNYIQDISF